MTDDFWQRLDRHPGADIERIWTAT